VLGELELVLELDEEELPLPALALPLVPVLLLPLPLPALVLEALPGGLPVVEAEPAPGDGGTAQGVMVVVPALD
jgi:hypothetical protein